MNHTLSSKLFTEAQKHLVGGVNSPVRAYKSVGGVPPFIVRAKGSHIWDADGNEFIDYVGTWGPAILGHAVPAVLNTLNEVMKNGTSFGAPTPLEIQMAQLVKEFFPTIELVRFVNSGTEATMSAIRAARGFTGKNKIIKFDGCYHGHADYLLVKAGSGAATLGAPDSLGVPESFAKETLIAKFNDIQSVEKLFSTYKNEIACVIIEPVVGNMGCIPPQKNFLKELRELTEKSKALLIFDEVMTGFRVSQGGAQELYGIKPDLTCLGKIIGAGLPVGAFGGRRDIMECVAPLGPVYQAGTLSGNPMAMSAGLALLSQIKNEKVYPILEEKGKYLEEGFLKIALMKKVNLVVNRVGSMFSIFFTSQPVTDAESARKADGEKFKKFFHSMLEEGIYMAPSAFEAAFISTTHSREDLDKTLFAFEKSLRNL